MSINHPRLLMLSSPAGSGKQILNTNAYILVVLHFDAKKYVVPLYRAKVENHHFRTESFKLHKTMTLSAIHTL